ncbi:hypothetical protein DINM_003758 [Dirofilaria immitis]|nr:hypothetical protein [Dirofilaria immitis]
MDSDILDLKQAIIDKLRYNGTLDRIQAELRCAVFLAIEDTENKRVEVDENKLNQKFGYSMIYHFLRQNRFLATAAVFEKEMQQNYLSSIRNEWKNEGEIRNDRSLRKSINDEIQKYSKGSSSRSESPKIFEQKQQTSDISSVRISKDQQQSPKHITSLSASYSGKLPPIATPTNQSNPSIKLPSIPSLNSPLTQTKTVAFSRMLDTVLNSSSSNISEIDEDIAEEIILDDMLQSDNNSDATISF